MPTPPEVRELGAPIFGDLVHQYRNSAKGIQYLASIGKDTTAAQAHLDAKNARRRTPKGRIARAVKSDIPFIAWDGEGWTDTDLNHRYNYFANSLGEFIEWPNLSSIRCLDFLLNTAARVGRAHHVIYGGGYDVTQWVRDMPMVYRDTLKKWGRVAWLDYSMEYIPNKWFKLTGYTTDKNGKSKRQTVTVYDVMTFYQTSFIKALESRGLEVPAEVVRGKASRSLFTIADMAFIRDYTGHELRLLVALCDKLREEFREAGMPVRSYYGPGAVANAVMKLYGVKDHMQAAPMVPVDTEWLCCAAYFGGRFEPLQIGHTEQPIYQADICSAYPDKIRDLPSLKDSHWEYRDHYTGELGIWKCAYECPPQWHLANPAPWRSRQGAVGFPRAVDEVWLWTYEAQYCDPGEGYVLITPDPTLPFAFIPGMYDMRRKWKAEGRGGQWALKLALNSLYGKMAQRVGGKDGMPPMYHQLAWAGMVTSATRAQLWRAMSLKPESVIAVETDSVMTTEKLDLDYGVGLGQWELAEYDWVTYLQSGIYWTSDGPKLKSKTRGVNVSELPHEMVMAYLAGDQSEGLPTTVHRFIGLNNPDRANYGQWIDSVRDLHVNGGKRWHLPGICSECQTGHTLADSLHRMHCAPDMGWDMSKPHPLPWRVDIEANEETDDTAELDWTDDL